MDHFFTIECQRYVSNPFALVHVAAQRARQLRRGSRSYTQLKSQTPPLMALEEIASGAYAGDALIALFGARPAEEPDDGIPYGELELIDGLSRSAAAELPSREREANDPDDSDWKEN